jgi:hypothetical protein
MESPHEDIISCQGVRGSGYAGTGEGERSGMRLVQDQPTADDPAFERGALPLTLIFKWLSSST